MCGTVKGLKEPAISKYVLSRKSGLSPGRRDENRKLKSTIVLTWNVPLILFCNPTFVHNDVAAAETAVKIHSWPNGYPRPLCWSSSSGDANTDAYIYIYIYIQSCCCFNIFYLLDKTFLRGLAPLNIVTNKSNNECDLPVICVCFLVN